MHPRRVITSFVALVLLGLAAGGLIRTTLDWADCLSEPLGQACMRLVDYLPGQSVQALASLAAVLLCIVGVIAARRALLSWLALLLVVLGSALDFFVAQALWTADYSFDIAPGTGYVTAAALGGAGVLFLWIAAAWQGEATARTPRLSAKAESARVV